MRIYCADLRHNELLDVVFRWAHLIAGIMWIGNSMLFNWLDRNLVKSAGDHALSQGKIYMVHSGAFYEVEKKLLPPGALPDPLHWFKWQNGITWMTGICLMVIVYYGNGAAFLVDPSVRALSPTTAILLSAGTLVAGFAVYDLIWRTLGPRAPVVATALSFALLFASAYGFTLLFSGRAAYIQTGVLIGTVMTGNVWMVILPSQRELIAATREGRDQDPSYSIKAKQRSIHNNYLTFPLLFIMVSNHFPSTYGHHLGWAILFAVMVGGAGVRHFMNVRYAVPRQAWLAPAAVMASIAIVGLLVLSRVARPALGKVDGEVGFARAQEIIVTRCVSCHASTPTDTMFVAPPNNIKFETAEQIKALAPRILDRAVVNQTMPFLNRTAMTAQERAELGAWIEQGAKLQ